MAVIALRLILLIVLISIVQSRILSLHSSDDDLISDGVDLAKNQPSYLGESSPPSSSSTCNHQYGFLPCAENAAGYVFQILVYQGLLIYGEKQIGKGSEVLFNIIGAGKLGGVIFRILMSLPSMMLMIVSGVFSSKENAQAQVSVGVGIYAGMTVFNLTVQWGICVIFGRRDLLQKSTTTKHTAVSHSNCLIAKETLTVLKDTGVVLDKETQHTAGIMLLSLIPYIIVQLDGIFNSRTGNRIVNLIALVVSSFSLLSYFAYQILNPWIQQRSLDYAKYAMLRTGFLQHVQRQGQIVNENGTLNAPVIKKLFSDTDKDANKYITKAEMEKLVLDVIETGKVTVDDGFAVSQVMGTFDFNDDMSITEEEFVDGYKKWIDETNQSSNKSDSPTKNIFHELSKLFKEKKENDREEIDDRIMSKILKHAESQVLKAESLVTPDGKPDIEHIKTLFNQLDTDADKLIARYELEKLINSVKFGGYQPKYDKVVKQLLKEFDTDKNSTVDEQEFVEVITKWLNKAIRVANTPESTKTIDKFNEIVWRQEINDKWALIRAIFQISLGIVMLTFLGGPLLGGYLQLSNAMRLPSFSVTFVVVPLALNWRATLAAILPASQKSERTASLIFSEIYGGVIMNNIAGMTTLLVIVYAKDLTFNFSAEVLTILAVCAVIGILARSRTTYPLWTSILAFSLYPLSLVLFYFVQFFWLWN